MSFLTLDHLQKSFGATRVVHDFDLAIEKGEFVSFLGPSGCGKTTVLRMVAGFETPTAGRVVIDGQDVTRARPNQRQIGMVFQSYALFPNLTVAENVGFGLRVAGVPRADRAGRVAEMLDLIGLPDLGGRYPWQLSGGQQQRVALARAVVTRPKVLLFDEPLSNLDAQLRERMRDELRAIQLRLGITSLYVTHDQSEAMAISDRVVVMRNGVVEQADTPMNVYARPGTAFVAEFMGKANILEGEVQEIGEATVRTRIAGASFELPRGPHPLRPGQRVRCVLRPEYLRIDPQGPLTATVKRVVFQGGHVEYLTEIGGQECTVTDAQYFHGGIAEQGRPLRLALDTRPVWMLADDQNTNALKAA